MYNMYTEFCNSNSKNISPEKEDELFYFRFDVYFIWFCSYSKLFARKASEICRQECTNPSFGSM